MKQVIIYFLISTLLISSCSVNSHVMLKTPKDFVFDTPPEEPITEYVISPNDIIKFKLYSNDGFLIIDLTAGTTGSVTGFAQNISYVIDYKGNAELPILGTIKLSELTINEATIILQDKYEEFYVSPFVQLEIINKRVIIFPGTGSDAKVITLKNNNTKLIEVLGMAGGISRKGKAARIKILRETKERREIYLVDLSTIEGIGYADMIVQANDIIYVEPVPDIAREVLADITPVISLLSSSLFVWVTLRTLKN